MKYRTTLLSLFFVLGFFQLLCQKENPHNFEKKFSLASQAFMILTPILDPSPEYYQINLGYRFSEKEELSLEAISWTFQGPLGRQYGPDYESEESRFPGDVKAYGLGLAYKRMIYKGVFAQAHSTAFHQTYRDLDKKKIKNGFMLFNTVRLGYHFKIFKKRWFIAPSIAVTSWPLHTNLPDSFQVLEDQFPKYFLFEPGLHIGYCF